VSPAGFLLIALVIGVAGSLVVVLRSRQVSHPDQAMDEFRREMNALAPPPAPLDDVEIRTRIPFRPSDLGGSGGTGDAVDSSRDE
jgi:hypothetical protein